MQFERHFRMFSFEFHDKFTNPESTNNGVSITTVMQNDHCSHTLPGMK